MINRFARKTFLMKLNSSSAQGPRRALAAAEPNHGVQAQKTRVTPSPLLSLPVELQTLIGDVCERRALFSLRRTCRHLDDVASRSYAQRFANRAIAHLGETLLGSGDGYEPIFALERQRQTAVSSIPARSVTARFYEIADLRHGPTLCITARGNLWRNIVARADHLSLGYEVRDDLRWQMLAGMTPNLRRIEGLLPAGVELLESHPHLVRLPLDYNRSYRNLAFTGRRERHNAATMADCVALGVNINAPFIRSTTVCAKARWFPSAYLSEPALAATFVAVDPWFMGPRLQHLQLNSAYPSGRLCSATGNTRKKLPLRAADSFFRLQGREWAHFVLNNRPPSLTHVTLAYPYSPNNLARRDILAAALAIFHGFFVSTGAQGRASQPQAHPVGAPMLNVTVQFVWDPRSGAHVQAYLQRQIDARSATAQWPFAAKVTLTNKHSAAVAQEWIEWAPGTAFANTRPPLQFVPKPQGLSRSHKTVPLADYHACDGLDSAAVERLP